MFSATRLAWVAAPLAIAIGFAACGGADAQTRRERDRKPEPAPAPAPTPAPAPAQPGQQGQNSGPMLVQVKAEPSQAEWTKVCGKDPNTGTEICYTTRDFVSDQG